MNSRIGSGVLFSVLLFGLALAGCKKAPDGSVPPVAGIAGSTETGSGAGRENKEEPTEPAIDASGFGGGSPARDRLDLLWPTIRKVALAWDAGINWEFFCEGTSVTSDQYDQVLDFARDTRKQLAATVAGEVAKIFEFTHAKLVVNGKSVIARTKLGPGNTVVINQDAWLGLSDDQALQLVYHELGHQFIYSALGGPVADEQAISGFGVVDPGFQMLNRYGDCLTAYSDHLDAYPAEVLELSPLAYLRLDETVGQVASDLSTGRRHGSYQDDVVLGEPGALGSEGGTGVRLRNTVAGQGLNQHGRIELNLPAEVVGAGKTLSIAFFFKRSAASPRDPVFVFASPTERASFALDTLVSSSGGFGFSGGVVSYPGAMETLSASVPDSVVSTGQWNHVVVSYFSGNVGNSEIYVNGVRESKPAGIALGHGGKTLLSFGWNYGFTQTPVEFSVDEIAIWNRALTPNEIRGLYRAGNPSHSP